MLLDKRNELSLKVEEIQKHTQHSQNVVSKIEEYKASFKVFMHDTALHMALLDLYLDV